MQPGWCQPVRQEFMENECKVLIGVAYPGVRDNRSTINTRTGYDDDDDCPLTINFKHTGQIADIVHLINCVYYCHHFCYYYHQHHGHNHHYHYQVQKVVENRVKRPFRCELRR